MSPDINLAYLYLPHVEFRGGYESVDSFNIICLFWGFGRDIFVKLFLIDVYLNIYMHVAIRFNCLFLYLQP